MTSHKNQVKEFHPTIEEEKELAPKRHTTKRWGQNFMESNNQQHTNNQKTPLKV
jgi:hypothetical protein